jgi:hypothetical protein
MRTVLVQFGEVQRWGDGLAAVRLLTQAVAPSPTLPWLPGGAHPGRWLIRGLTLLAVLPLTVLAAVTDAITTPFLRRGTRSNAYRLIARKES